MPTILEKIAEIENEVTRDMSITHEKWHKQHNISLRVHVSSYTDG